MRKSNDKVFIPKTFIECGSCGDVICSLYSGHYTSCCCGNIGIDETEFTTRLLGTTGKRVAISASRLHKELYWLLRVANNYDTIGIDYLESELKGDN